jgi:uncharacterized protein YbaR (Trm112 family)
MDYQSLLGVLRCPETRQELRVAEPGLVRELNARAARGALKNRAGQAVGEALDSGLIRADGQFLYPIRRNVPVMLMDEALPLAQAAPASASKATQP